MRNKKINRLYFTKNNIVLFFKNRAALFLIACLTLSVFGGLTASLLTLNVSASFGASAKPNVSSNFYSDSFPEEEKRLFDDAGIFNVAGDFMVNDVGGYKTQGEALNAYLLETEAEVGFVVSVWVADYVGANKSDLAVEKYADTYFDNKFGEGTDGIMLLINLDNKYDYISVSGKCEYIFDEKRREALFDNIWGYMLAEDFATAIMKFCPGVKLYAEKGVISGYNPHGMDDGPKIGMILTVCLIADAVLIALTIVSVKTTYLIRPAKSAASYLERASVKYFQKTDTFIRSHITKTKLSSSSSGGRSGGGGGSRGSGRHR